MIYDENATVSDRAEIYANYLKWMNFSKTPTIFPKTDVAWIGRGILDEFETGGPGHSEEWLHDLGGMKNILEGTEVEEEWYVDDTKWVTFCQHAYKISDLINWSVEEVDKDKETVDGELKGYLFEYNVTSFLLGWFSIEHRLLVDHFKIEFQNDNTLGEGKNVYNHLKEIIEMYDLYIPVDYRIAATSPFWILSTGLRVKQALKRLDPLEVDRYDIEDYIYKIDHDMDKYWRSWRSSLLQASFVTFKNGAERQNVIIYQEKMPKSFRAFHEIMIKEVLHGDYGKDRTTPIFSRVRPFFAKFGKESVYDLEAPDLSTFVRLSVMMFKLSEVSKFEIISGDSAPEALTNATCPLCLEDINCSEKDCIQMYCKSIGQAPETYRSKAVQVCSVADMERMLYLSCPDTDDEGNPGCNDPFVPTCGHVMHAKCLIDYNKSMGTNKCPVCRKTLMPDSEARRFNFRSYAHNTTNDTDNPFVNTAGPSTEEFTVLSAAERTRDLLARHPRNETDLAAVEEARIAREREQRARNESGEEHAGGRVSSASSVLTASTLLGITVMMAMMP
jgi:hypothetical protein